MQVTFYSGFTKRVNSTKRPSGGTSVNINIKEPCDMHNPVIKIQGGHGQYNYFSIGSTYYYVTGETVFPNNWVELQGTIDPMATCADDIKNTKVFVERCFSGTTALADSLTPVTVTTKKLYDSSSALAGISRAGVYIVSIANMVAPVVMSIGEFLGLYNRLHDKDLVEQIEKVFSNLDGLITGAIWLPFSKGSIATAGTLNIKGGFVDTGVSASIIASEVKVGVAGFSLPLDSTILTSSMYCSLDVYLPFVGTVQLSIDDFKGSGSMAIKYAIDTHTGAMEYAIETGDGYQVATFGGTCGVPVPVGSTSYNVGALAGGVATAVAGVATGNPIGLFAGGAMMFSGLRSSTSTSGGSGSRAGLNNTSIRVTLLQKSPPEPLTNKSNVVGLPTYKTMQMPMGFVKCINASIESAEEGEIVAQCNAYLNSGAWIE